MNKRTTLCLAVIVLVTVAVAGCTTTAPATPIPPAASPVATAAGAPAQAAATPVGASEAVSEPTADARPTVAPPPADGSRPMAALSPAQRSDAFSGPAPRSVDAAASYIATIETSKGNIVAELYNDTPVGENNFVTLAENGFYDGLTFHRVEAGFVIQGGDPKGDGSGGPGYTIPAEIKHNHPRGALAWARTPDQVNPERRSSGSQFYITLGDASFLDGQYSVFGYVVEGMDVADKIAVGDTIKKIDISTAETSRLPSPTPTPVPAAPVPAEGRPLAKEALDKRGTHYNLPPALTIDPKKTYQATITSDKGDIVLDLDAANAPQSVNNFVVLANLGFYDGMPVAYVEPSTAVILGSPASAPNSDVGYQINLEKGASEAQVITGTVAYYPAPVAGTQEIKASGSLFFISFADMKQIGAQVNVFGKVASGMDVVQKLAAGDVIKSITIAEK